MSANRTEEPPLDAKLVCQAKFPVKELTGPNFSDGSSAIKLPVYPSVRLIFDRVIRFHVAVKIARLRLPSHYTAIISIKAEALSKDTIRLLSLAVTPQIKRTMSVSF